MVATNRLKNGIQRIYVYLILIFLYAPIVVLMVLSFNDSKSRSTWGGFTLEWYRELIGDYEIMSALGNTIVLGLLSAVIATVIGLFGAIGIDAMKKRGYRLTMGFGNIPMLNADIVTGIALMLFLSRFINLGFGSVLLAHITFSIPYVVLSILPKLKQTDIAVYEAARDLGASQVTAFVKVILPGTMPAIMSGFFMALTMSIDDFVVTYFTKGPGFNTLSTMIYAQVRRGIKPQMYALSTIIFVVVLVILLLVNYVPEIAEKRAKKRK